MARCSAITASNTRCKGTPIAGSDLCYAHHPEREQDRKRYGAKGGRRGGRGRPLAEVGDIRARIEELYKEVRNGTIDTRIGTVLNQILNTQTRLVETALRAREQEELIGRIEELEQQHEQHDERILG